MPALPGGSPRAPAGPGRQTPAPQNAAERLGDTDGDGRGSDSSWGGESRWAPQQRLGDAQASLPSRRGSEDAAPGNGDCFILGGKNAPRCPPLLGVSPGQRLGPGGAGGERLLLLLLCPGPASCAGKAARALRGTLCSWLRVSLLSAVGKGGWQRG